MRINKYLAQATGLARRAADQAIAQGRVRVNGQPATAGQDVSLADTVTLDNKKVGQPRSPQTIMLHKPVGYVVSRARQGSKTIYDLLPPELHHLKPIGRLDKDSSGLLLLTNDGALAQELTHPSHQKHKVYEVELDKPLQPSDHHHITGRGVALEDGLSRLELTRPRPGNGQAWRVRMHEGRNRQIRRTFAALGYKVTRLHRIQFGDYPLAGSKSKEWRYVNQDPRPRQPSPDMRHSQTARLAGRVDHHLEKRG
jgi:23S rRNA pseudouridine2605 synthase